MRATTTRSYLTALVLLNLKAALANRAAFWLQAIFMFLNNVVYFVTWWIFFARFESIGGWRLADLVLLYGLVASGFGGSVILCGGVRDLSRLIVDGELDAALTRPKSPLLQAICGRGQASGFGDVATGLLFLALAGAFAPDRLAITLLCLATGTILFTATGILVHTLAFWVGPIEDLARQILNLVVTFGIYPPPLFGGFSRLLLFTVLPAGFVGHVPAGLLRHFDWQTLAALVAATVLYGLLARALFERGLRVYASGNRVVVQS